MTWHKINLVTAKDGSDTLGCTVCGHKEKYYGLERPADCPMCRKAQAQQDIIGCWGRPESRHTCHVCQSALMIVPRKGHPNSKYWDLERDDADMLLCCPVGCIESGRVGIDKRIKT